MESKKVDIVMAKLSCGIYRPWYWANYKDSSRQKVFRMEWVNVLDRYTHQQIREGLDNWALQFGVDTPPTPVAFADFLKPVSSSASRAGIAVARRLLSD